MERLVDNPECSVVTPCHNCDYCREYYAWLNNNWGYDTVGFGDLDFEHGETGPHLGSDEVMLWLLICELAPKSRIAGMLYAGLQQCVSEDRAQYR